MPLHCLFACCPADTTGVTRLNGLRITGTSRRAVLEGVTLRRPCKRGVLHVRRKWQLPTRPQLLQPRKQQKMTLLPWTVTPQRLHHPAEVLAGPPSLQHSGRQHI